MEILTEEPTITNQPSLFSSIASIAKKAFSLTYELYFNEFINDPNSLMVPVKKIGDQNGVSKLQRIDDEDNVVGKQNIFMMKIPIFKKEHTLLNKGSEKQVICLENVEKAIKDSSNNKIQFRGLDQLKGIPSKDADPEFVKGRSEIKWPIEKLQKEEILREQKKLKISLAKKRYLKYLELDNQKVITKSSLQKSSHCRKLFFPVQEQKQYFDEVNLGLDNEQQKLQGKSIQSQLNVNWAEIAKSKRIAKVQMEEVPKDRQGIQKQINKINTEIAELSSKFLIQKDKIESQKVIVKNDERNSVQKMISQANNFKTENKKVISETLQVKDIPAKQTQIQKSTEVKLKQKVPQIESKSSSDEKKESQCSQIQNKSIEKKPKQQAVLLQNPFLASSNKPFEKKLIQAILNNKIFDRKDQFFLEKKSSVQLPPPPAEPKKTQSETMKEEGQSPILKSNFSFPNPQNQKPPQMFQSSFNLNSFQGPQITQNSFAKPQSQTPILPNGYQTYIPNNQLQSLQLAPNISQTDHLKYFSSDLEQKPSLFSAIEKTSKKEHKSKKRGEKRLK